MFSPDKFVEEKVNELKKTIDGKAIIGVSGGVDSTTTAVITKKAIGNRLISIFVDTGYLRKDEVNDVKKILKNLSLNPVVVDGKKNFQKKLRGIIDPEKKRKAIGAVFVEIFENIAKKEKAKYLVQGTIAPDWIESGSYLRDRIKSHHNVAGLPKKLKLKIVEPLKELYKDEVRKVAEFLNINIAKRQPFPGPGLAVRVIGEAKPESISIVRKANAIIEEEIENACREGVMKKPWQYFAVLLPVRTTGVHGDLRAYGSTIAIRAVESVDGMTAEYSKIPYEVLEKISIRVTNEMKDKVNRVVYDITNKPPSTIEWE